MVLRKFPAVMLEYEVYKGSHDILDVLQMSKCVGIEFIVSTLCIHLLHEYLSFTACARHGRLC